MMDNDESLPLVERVRAPDERPDAGWVLDQDCTWASGIACDADTGSLTAARVPVDGDCASLPPLPAFELLGASRRALLGHGGHKLR